MDGLAHLKGLAYVRQKKGGPSLWVAKRDFDALQRARGYVVIPDLVEVPSETVVLEIDQDRMTSRPVGLVTQASNVRFVARYARSQRAISNPLVRVRDIVDLQGISRETGRVRKTIEAKWMTKPDWPKPIMRLGNTHGYFFFHVADFLRRHNLRVRKEKG